MTVPSGGLISVAALALVCALTLVPGLGAVLALFGPGELGWPTGAALTFAFGFAFPALLAFALALGRVLHAASFFGALGALTVALWALAMRRAGPSARLRALRSQFAAEPWAMGVGVVVILGMAVAFGTFSPLLNFHHASPFRYWADGLEVADAGRIPAATLQWGRLYPATVSKVLLNTFNAAMKFALGRDALRALPPLVWLAGVGTAVGLWALFRELGMARLAPLAPVLLVMNRVFLNREMTLDLESYKAELFGRLVAAAAAALAVRALRDRAGRRPVVVAGALLGVGAATHLVPAVVAVLVFGLYALGRVALDRDLRATAARTAAIGVLGAALAGAVLLTAGGDVGFGGARGNQQYAEFGPGFDPTRFFSSGNPAVSRLPPKRTFYYSPVFVVRTYVEQSLGSSPPWPVQVAVGVGAVGLAAVVFLFFPRELRPIGLVAVGLAGSLIAVALYFSYRYDLWILARFGMRRMFDYSAIPLVLLGLAAVEAGLGATTRIRAWVPAVGGAALSLAVAAAIVPLSLPDPALSRTGQGALAPLTWMRENLPCDARILSDQRTAGTFEAMTGRAGILEGMAPYLRPDVLRRVVRLMLEARSFFQDPARDRAFLTSQGVDYVLVSRGIPLGAAGANLRASPGKLRRDPDLLLVYRSGGLQLFKVVGAGAGAAPGIPRPSGQPGFRCVRTPLASAASSPP